MSLDRRIARKAQEVQELEETLEGVREELRDLIIELDRNDQMESEDWEGTPV
jgi:predicted component of type VI protein secretion system